MLDDSEELPYASKLTATDITEKPIPPAILFEIKQEQVCEHGASDKYRDRLADMGPPANVLSGVHGNDTTSPGQSDSEHKLGQIAPDDHGQIAPNYYETPTSLNTNLSCFLIGFLKSIPPQTNIPTL